MAFGGGESGSGIPLLTHPLPPLSDSPTPAPPFSHSHDATEVGGEGGIGTCDIWKGEIWCGENLVPILKYHSKTWYKILLPSAVHLEERLTVSQSVS